MSITKISGEFCMSATTSMPRIAAKEEREQEEQRLYYVALTRAKARLYLPLVPAESWSNRWDGGYRRVNKRLLVVENELSRNSKRASVQSRPIPGSPDRRRSGRPGSAGSRPRLVAAAASAPGGSPTLVGLRQAPRQHAGYEVSSYSRMKRAWSEEIDPLERAEFRRDPGRATVAVTPAEGELPGGTASGTMLHEISEFIPSTP